MNISVDCARGLYIGCHYHPMQDRICLSHRENDYEPDKNYRFDDNGGFDDGVGDVIGAITHEYIHYILLKMLDIPSSTSWDDIGIIRDVLWSEGWFI